MKKVLFGIIAAFIIFTISSSVNSPLSSSSSNASTYPHTPTVYTAGQNDAGQACYWTGSSTTPTVLDTASGYSYAYSIFVQ